MMKSKHTKGTLLIVVTFLLFYFSCDHNSLDPESSIKNMTAQKITIYRASEGNLFGLETIQPGESKFYCICKPININGDSTVIKLALEDSIVYHNQHVTNSNFEQTKGRSFFVPETWNEFDKNKFEYTILPSDFR